MLTNSVIGIIRRRNAAERPFLGSTTESLHAKLECAAITEETKRAVMAELARRVDYGSPKLFEARRG